MRRDDRASGLRFEPKDGAQPEATSGQVGPKSAKGEKFRQDSEKARPSERLRRDDAPPAGDGGKAGPKGKAERKMDKSKLRMEKTSAKLDKAKNAGSNGDYGLMVVLDDGEDLVS